MKLILKPTKKKILLSLIPFYLFALFIPFIIDLIWSGFSNSAFGFFLEGFSIIGYLIFLLMLYPFYHIFEALGLMKMEMVGMTIWASPNISFLGFIFLAFIYSCIIYLIISFRDRRKKDESRSIKKIKKLA